jgi:fluoride ion exporter CrcB/FEX
MDILEEKNHMAQKINYIVVHIVITVVAYFLGQKVELKQDLKLFNFL